ncbi:Antibiotic biosynthesis monooxygenase [hydrothermal vent metagenome]|uniref:Antibiotic biosynthesis monooxygenase n=1 Tax=hydrothermal vent metagenome TaxID=652676 RepID=A0A1W1EKV6_9ZZZZ
MSKRIYCTAQFTPKEGEFEALFNRLKALEPNTLREDGCINYRVTKHIQSPFATGDSMPIVFHETWRDNESFEEHCQRDEIVEFFNSECLSSDGLVESYNVTVYSDE